MRRNFSLVACYLLKFIFCLLLVVKSLVTRGKIRQLLVAEVACCKKSLVTRCKIHSLVVAEVARCKKSLVTRCRSCLLQKITLYQLQNSPVARCRSGVTFCNFMKKYLQHRCFPVTFCETLRTSILQNICKRLLPKIISNVNKLFTVFYVNQVFHFDLIKFD